VVTDEGVGRAAKAVSATVPPLMAKAPVRVGDASKVSEPAPVLTREPAPATALAKVTSFAPTSIVAVLPARTVRLLETSSTVEAP